MLTFLRVPLVGMTKIYAISVFFNVFFILKLHKNFILKICYFQQIEEKRKSRIRCPITCPKRLMGIKVRTHPPLVLLKHSTTVFPDKTKTSSYSVFLWQKSMCSYYISNCPDFVIVERPTNHISQAAAPLPDSPSTLLSQQGSQTFQPSLSPSGSCEIDSHVTPFHDFSIKTFKQTRKVK